MPGLWLDHSSDSTHIHIPVKSLPIAMPYNNNKNSPISIKSAANSFLRATLWMCKASAQVPFPLVRWLLECLAIHLFPRQLKWNVAVYARQEYNSNNHYHNRCQYHHHQHHGTIKTTTTITTKRQWNAKKTQRAHVHNGTTAVCGVLSNAAIGNVFPFENYITLIIRIRAPPHIKKQNTSRISSIVLHSLCRYVYLCR